VVAGVVGSVVVLRAEKRCVFEVCGAAVGPGDEVVGFGPGAGDVAALRAALGLGEESLSAAEVEDFGVCTQDGRNDPGGAGQASGVGGGDGVVPVAGCAV